MTVPFTFTRWSDGRCGLNCLNASRLRDRIVTSPGEGDVTTIPLGVCAGITPFNFPAMVPMWMYPLAITCGNTFILKPSEKVPLTAIRLAELFAEAGLPDGVLNIIHGGREIVDSICTHPGIASVSFVGSSHVAAHVYSLACQKGKRVQAAGGAKNVLLVMPDAEPDATLRAILGSSTAAPDNAAWRDPSSCQSENPPPTNGATA
ncbi:MAG: aldehyde dehydrogenase family protein [Akkermansiaceae bacterium]|nr:aldehyde dehydrogenase family protein [Akkermansiaceae bacterium]